MKEFIKKHPFVLAVLYLIYTLSICLVVGSSNQYLVTPLVAPLTILLGIFVWQWQEEEKNSTARNELYKKKYNEKSENIFRIYTKYEKSIQNLYRLFSGLRVVIAQNPYRKIEKSKEISLEIKKISAELKLINEVQLDLYNEIVLFFHFKLNNNCTIDPKNNIYSDAHNLINELVNYKYISEEISKLVESYLHNERSQLDKDMGLISEYFKLLPTIESFDFGQSEDPNKNIYIKPRKRFLELTRAL